ncbi:transposable element Tcb1 transposase [Trichonephila clavipes]|nr:transposable element Tcb1 transposase [Trichonephila clavipes]
MLGVRPVSTRTVRKRFQQLGLSARGPLLRLPLTIQHSERRRLWGTERQSWIQKWHNVVFFCLSFVQNSYISVRTWRLREDRFSPACIRYRFRDPTPSVMAWTSIR